MKFFICSCTSHALSVQRLSIDDEDTTVSFPEIELSIWQHPSDTVRNRLRLIWHIIRYGHPYADFIVLEKDEATKLRDHLTELIEIPVVVNK